MNKKLKNNFILKNCTSLRKAYEDGLLGNMKMPEDAKPAFKLKEQEKRLVYFTLPMSLNYQRNSYSLFGRHQSDLPTIRTEYPSDGEPTIADMQTWRSLGTR